MKKIKLILTGLLLGVLVSNVHAQEVFGYFPSYRATSVLDNQGVYDKVTDIAFSFINGQSNGTLITSNPGDALYGFDMNKFIVVRDKCQANGVNLWISVAGADPAELRSARMKTICSNASSRNTFVTQLLNFALLHDCYGISIDWEFPKDAAARNAHVALLEDLYNAIAVSSNPDMEISIAVGGEYTGGFNHIQYVHPDLFGSKGYLIDDWHIMSYDLPASYNINHSSTNDCKVGLQTYESQGVPMNKMLMGIPFYARNANRTSELEFSNMGCSSTQYNSDVSNGFYYNGINTIKAKIDDVIDLGAKGVLIWDLGQDCSGQFSLLKGIDDYLLTICPIPSPNLGADQGVCGGSTITLDPNVPTASGRTFTWYKDGSVVVSASSTQSTYDVSDAATYKVVIDQGPGCSDEDEIKVVTGSSVSVSGSTGCANEDITLTVTNPAVGKTYNWYDQASGGGKLFSGTSYTAQYTTTTDIYVEEQEDGVVEYQGEIEGVEALPNGVFWAWDNSDLADLMTVETDLTIKGVRVYAKGVDGATFTIQVLNSNVVGTDNAVLQETQEFVIAPNASAGAFEFTTFDVDLDIQLTPGQYFIFPKVTSGTLTMANSVGRTVTGVPGVFDLGEHVHKNFGNGFLTSQVTDPSYSSYGFLWKYQIQTGASASCGRTKTTAVVQGGGVDAPDITGSSSVTAGTTENYEPASFSLGITYNYSYSGTGVTINPLLDGEVELVFASDATSGILTLSLDNGSPCGDGTSSELPITVSAANQDPEATITANPDANIIEGDNVVLTFGGTDPDSDPITVTSITLDGNAQSWTSPETWVAVAGSHTFEVTISDGQGGSDIASITLNVAANQDPEATITANPDANIIEGDDVVLTFGGTDPDGDVVTITSITLDGNAQSWTSPETWEAVVGSHTFEVTVEDGRGGSDVASLTLNVVANQDPVATITASPDANIIEGDNVVLTFGGTDPDGDAVTVTLITLDGNAQSWTSPETWVAIAGSHTFEVTIEDTRGGSNTASTTLNVAVNQAPEILLDASSLTGVVGENIVFTWSATDPEGDIPTVTISLDGNVQSWTSPETWVATTGIHLIEVTAIDGKGKSSSQSITVEITDPQNESPEVEITSPSDGAPFTMPTTVELTAEATDDNQVVEVVYTITGPSSETIVGSGDPTWLGSWTPTEAGTYTITAIATDDDQATGVSPSVMVEISDVPNRDPEATISANPNTNIIEGDNVVFTFGGTDPDGDDVVVRSITMDGNSQLWTSPETWVAIAGSHTFEVTIEDGRGGSDIASITLNVAVNQAPEILLDASSLTGVVGENIVFTWSATDPEGDIPTVTISLDGNVQSWTSPETWVATTGIHLIEVTAIDGKGKSSSQSITVEITDPQNESPEVEITSPSSGSSFVLPTPVNLTARATDDNQVVGVVYNISGPSSETIVGSGDPTWLGSWTPTEAGTYTITAIVADNDNATGVSSAVTVVISDLSNTDPVVTITSPSNGSSFVLPTPVNLTANAVDDGQVTGVVYSITGPAGTTVTGANAPAWSASWTPTAAGIYTITATATDNDNNTSISSSITVTIRNIGGSDNEAIITFISPVDNERMANDFYLVQAFITDADGLANAILKIVDNSNDDPLFNVSTPSLNDDGSGSYSYTWSAFDPGEYTLTIITTDINGETTESAPIDVTVDVNFGVGLSDDLDPFKLSMVVYPNPTIFDANVDFNVENAGSGTLSILDMSGNVISVVSEGYFNSGIQTVSLSETNELAIGMYLLRLTVDGEVIVRKFVKQ